jgi:hypothetical protein
MHPLVAIAAFCLAAAVAAVGRFLFRYLKANRSLNASGVPGPPVSSKFFGECTR